MLGGAWPVHRRRACRYQKVRRWSADGLCSHDSISRTPALVFESWLANSQSMIWACSSGG